MSCAKNAYQPSSRDPSCRGKIAESSSPPALDGRRRELGDAHPHYGDTCKFYAEFFEKQAMFSEAASYYDQAAHAYEQSYGADHEETRDARTKADACRSKAADA
mmetsp:Transcript_2073/g.5553  ORF Transcript_2073/g.5553 Transcript_2073/m.5553 type:complete len:104 (-) Transcript_2073:53-364(-)